MKPQGTKRLETDRLILRRFVIEDAEDMYQNWTSDPEVTKYLTWPTHSSLDVTKAVLEDWLPKYEDDNYYNWAIEYKETGKVIGSISVVKLNDIVDSADIGYCMSRALWGNGIMPEALTAVINFLFDEVGLNRIAAYHDANNPKSGRVMDKAGMKLEGVWRQAGKNNQGICDEVWHSIIRSDRLKK
jgi:[ribosomal protein S5]-alanine N-acetyltransferase